MGRKAGLAEAPAGGLRSVVETVFNPDEVTRLAASVRVNPVRSGMA
jgi:hypothetical protein